MVVVGAMWGVSPSLEDFVGRTLLVNYRIRCNSGGDRLYQLPKAPSTISSLGRTLEDLGIPLFLSLMGLYIMRTFPLEPSQKKFLLVAINYFLIWVKAKPLAKITKDVVWKFLRIFDNEL